MLIFFDLVILLFLLVAFVKGYRKGLISMLISMATIVIAAIFGGKIAETIHPHISETINASPQWSNIIAYTLAFLLIALVLSLIGRVVQKLFEAVYLGFINRIAGAIISIASTMIILSLVINLITAVDFQERLIKPHIKKESFFYERVQAVIPAIVPYLNFESIQEIIPEFQEQSQPSQYTTYLRRIILVS